MKKYALHTEHLQYDPEMYNSPEDAYWASDNHNDEEVGIFDTFEEAEEIFKKTSVSTFICKSFYKGYIADATVAFIFEAEYDLNEYGEWEYVEGMDFWAFKCEVIQKKEEKEEEE